MKVGLSLAVVAIVLALAAMSLDLRGTAVGHAPTLQFAEFYQGGGARGLILSDKLVALHGQRVVMAGFMAPPLKPALDFFVLTRVPLALCPFCASDAQWPEDIVFVRLPSRADAHANVSALASGWTVRCWHKNGHCHGVCQSGAHRC